MTKLHLIQLDLHYNMSVLLAIILYRTYSMINNDSTINVETKNNRMNKMTKLHLIHIEFTLQYITLTTYYIVKYTFR